MSAPAIAEGRPTLQIRGTPYPVLLPSVRDPRLHLAAVIVSLQVLGQAAFAFQLSIAQILIAVFTCALLEIGITFWRGRVIMWPASALITGNGVGFVLRVPGTRHGDWWSTRGWWIFAATAAVSLLSKYVIRLRGAHVFNPSNFGLVLCFLVLGSGRADPLDFWWGPMSAWMALALAIIVVGGLAILSRLRLLAIAVGFWLAFAAGIGVLAATGHAMSARWHLGPVTGGYFWSVLVTSPEILVFLFFMITDPKTTPSRLRPRLVYAVGVGLLAALLIAPARTEFWSKVAVLGALAIVCLARPVVERFAPSLRLGRRALTLAGAGALAAYFGVLVAAGIPARSSGGVQPLAVTGRLPQITILPSKGLASPLDRHTARVIASVVVSDLRLQADEQLRSAAGRTVLVPSYRVDRISMRLEAGQGQGPLGARTRIAGVRQVTTYTGSPPMVVRRSDPVPFEQTVLLGESASPYRWFVVRSASRPAATRSVASFAGVRLTDVARQVGLDFRQDDFRFGVSNDVHSMMGGGLCWLDYNNDGWLDLFVVNSYSDADVAAWNARGGLPRSALFENVHGRFVNVGARSHANVAVQGNGCVAADLNGDGYTDLLVTTNAYNVLLWNNGNGTFTDGTHAAGIDAFGTYGWHTGAAVADVNGDGRPDLFVAGYADVNAQIPGSDRGFPANHQGVRDLLFLNEGNGKDGRARFREVGVQAGLDRPPYDHSLGAVFTDVNGDGRPDLYVANDLDPNRLYLNEPGGPLGFHFVEQGRAWGVADPNAGMGVAAQDYSGDGRPDLFVTNSRGQGHAAFRATAGPAFANARSVFAPAVGATGTGWGDSWIDLANNGRLDLVLANGAIPITNLKRDAGTIQVIENLGGRFADASRAVGLSPGPLLNWRGLAAADYDNDGRVDIAVSSIGGKLVLLHNTGDSGHWLEVGLARFAPGALVTAVLPDGSRLVREVQAGSSYLSSEDPRVHFGLGAATKVVELTVRYPGGRTARLRNIAANRIVEAPAP